MVVLLSLGPGKLQFLAAIVAVLISLHYVQEPNVSGRVDFKGNVNSLTSIDRPSD